LKKLFGTDGVRGVVGKELTGELARKLGRAAASVLAKEKQGKAKFIIGADTRASREMLTEELSAGLREAGADVIVLGVLPTPAVAFLTRKMEADSGVVISASHNPAHYNGIKFFNNQGFKLSDEIEAEIERIVNENTSIPPSNDKGEITHHETASKEYEEFAKSTIDADLSGLKIAIDCAHGASYAIAHSVFSSLGSDSIIINDKPNGENINANCGSTHIESLAEKVVQENADFGLAFDGDADRVLAIDENGKLIDGDKIMMICAHHMSQNELVATVMSNLGLFKAAEKHGIKVKQTAVGDRYVVEEMVKSGIDIGGEQSGHIIFLNHNSTGDGLVTGLQLASIIKKTGKKLSELASIMSTYPQVLVNAKVPNDKKYTYNQHAGVSGKIAELEKKFAGEGRVLIRPSGTEALVRVMIEGKDESEIKTAAEELAHYIEETLCESLTSAS
jgi:phosphoglucosamine mutase